MNGASMAASSSRAARLRRAGAAAAAFLALALALYLKAVPCIFALTFHTPCPACGSTRAVLALLHGDVAAALRFNPFGPFAALLLALFGCHALASLFVHGDLRDFGRGAAGRVLVRLGVAVALLQTSFWLARLFGAFGGPVPV